MVAEHTLGQVDRTRRRTQRGRHDEAEHVQDAGDQGDVDVAPAGGPVRVRIDGVSYQSDRQEEGGEPDGHRSQQDH